MHALIMMLAMALIAPSWGWVQIGARQALVKVPFGIDEPSALVIVLHWGNGSAQDMKQATGYNELSSRDDVIVAYGQAEVAHWNAGDCCKGANADDVQYLHTLIGTYLATGAVDPDRVYLVGSSNGGMLAYRYVCEHPGIVAAIAVSSGLPTIPTCPNPAPVHVLHWQGQLDNLVPFEGGYSEPLDATFWSLEQIGETFGHGGDKRVWDAGNAEITRYRNGVTVKLHRFYDVGHGDFPPNRWDYFWNFVTSKERP